MFREKKFLAVIPARKGSKGLPKKNIKPLLGKPLIAWTIEEALQSSYLDKVIVSSDDEDILTVAKQFGADVPFIRPEYLAQDNTKTYDVLEHAIEMIEMESNEVFDYIVLLEPTSPLRQAFDIDNAIEELLNSSEASSIVGVGKTESQNPAFLVLLDKDSFIQGFQDKNMSSIRRQDIRDVYFFEGSIYVSEVKTFLNKKSFYHSKTIAYKLPKYKTIEIDDIYDFIMAEALLKNRIQNNELSRKTS